MKTKEIFCAACQQLEEHNVVVDGNGEFLFTCTTCEHFFKLPGDMSVEEINDYLTEHEEVNAGQVSAAAVEAAFAQAEETLSEL